MSRKMKYLALKPEWWRAIDKVPVNQLRGFIKALLDYATSDDTKNIGVNLTGIAAGVFLALSAEIEGARLKCEKKADNGGKGGKASGKSRKQKEAKGSKAKQNEAKPSDDSVCFTNQNQNQEEKVDDKSSTQKKLPPTIEQFQAMAVKAGVPADFAEYLHGELTRCEWTDADGAYIANPIRYLKSAWNAEQKKIRAARADVGPLGLGGGIQIAR